MASEAGQLYLEEVDESVQSDSGLQEYVDKAIAKKKEELFTYFNKAQSVANPAVGEGFMEEVNSLTNHPDLQSLTKCIFVFLDFRLENSTSGGMLYIVGKVLKISFQRYMTCPHPFNTAIIKPILSAVHVTKGCWKWASGPTPISST